MDEKKKSNPAEQHPKATKTMVNTRFPIVGVGASAGGLAAFEVFFAGMPRDVEPNMAFILVQHLAPDHKSLLSEIVRRYTHMEVFEVIDGMTVNVNCIYVIPPNYDMAFINGRLQLLTPPSLRSQRLPIDFFFRSLAVDQGDYAIGIILSGTGSDGTLGVRAIKAEGGMVMAQTPDSSEYNSMPLNAIATGLVDYQLVVSDMAAVLIAFVKQGYGQISLNAKSHELQAENAMMKVFVLLREQTGHDFSQYKPNTIHRRIERRMAVHQLVTLEHYVVYLQEHTSEIDHLFRDLLIGVTNFFRDKKAFAGLESQVITSLFTERPLSATIRVWVPGCSTGEEAYSIAILIYEKMQVLKKNYKVQIFATDIDVRAVDVARAGIYPASCAKDISSERFSRFFTPEGDGSTYRIHKNIRDMLVFSEQNLIKDPPFSLLDLISCRNLLIYMDTELQRKVIPLFHYALNPGGTLFLGSSEGINEFSDLFEVTDRKLKIFHRKEDFHGLHRLSFSRLLMASTHDTRASTRRKDMSVKTDGGSVSLRALTEKTLLLHVKSACALVNAHGDIFYLFGRTGLYLEPSEGESSVNNILKMARKGLQLELSTALHTAALQQIVMHSSGLQVKTNGDFSSVNLTIRPAVTLPGKTLDTPLFLVILDLVSDQALADYPPSGMESVVEGDSSSAAEAQIVALTQQLRAKEDYLHATNEALETSNEELKSSNEEMQSINEELQSTNEEMETSKEELQSVNEELSTVNAELQNKMNDLTLVNNDMSNLLAGTGIATVFVDLQLRIMRFTPAATSIINLIPSDGGRPMADIVTNLLNYEQLLTDIQAVLDTLIPIALDVETVANKWYTMRILPYRTMNNTIEGAVLTFFDITEAKQSRESLQKIKDVAQLGVLLQNARDAITVQNLTGQTLAWNHSATQLYGWNEQEALAINVAERIPEDKREEALATTNHLSLAEKIEPYKTQRLTKAGVLLDIWMTSTALLDENGNLSAIATMERVIGESDHG